jgi:hypothetical protein
VVVRFEDHYRLTLGAAHVGVSASDLGSDPIALRLDDGALGVSLLETLSEKCPKPAEACAVWLDGYRGPLVAMPDDDEPGEPKKWPFAVLRVHELIDPQAHLDGKAVHAQIETAP